MSDVSIASALKAREQCEKIDPAMMIGLTAMIGQNDEHGEVFGLDDACNHRTAADSVPPLTDASQMTWPHLAGYLFFRFEAADRLAASSGDAAAKTGRPQITIDGNTALAYDYDVEPEPELIEIPVEQRKTLLQLTEKTCRWPVGDPGSADFFFCGGETVNELPYCSYHSRVAYQPLTDRRRDKRPFRS